MLTLSRSAVAKVLHDVFQEGRRVHDAWDQKLTKEDAMLAQAMLGLCLRHWGRLQAVFESRLKDPERGAPLGSRIAAALGLAQLAWLPGVSDHAAVNESVNLAADPELGFPPHKGLINAILRKGAADRAALAAELEAIPASRDRSPFAQEVLEAALAPRGQVDQVEALWSRLQRIPAPTFLALDEAPLPEGMGPDPLCPGALRLAEDAPFPRPWLAGGHGMVQDRSSQALMAFQWDREPQRILDACAAPGGKTTALGRRWPQAELWAIEKDPRRARRLEENLRQRSIHAKVAVDDARAWLRSGGRPFDLILLDAPCSGSGTLGKHPELTWIGDDMDPGPLLRIQRELLDAAVERLAPGGLLVYAVCSWFPAEGLAHREALLARHPELQPAAVWPGEFGLEHPMSSVFLPDPLTWEGEGFQGFAVRKP